MEEEGCLIVEVSFIPKNIGASDAKDYRPISLIGGVYKIVAKVLTTSITLNKLNGLNYLVWTHAMI